MATSAFEKLASTSSRALKEIGDSLPTLKQAKSTPKYPKEISDKFLQTAICGMSHFVGFCVSAIFLHNGFFCVFFFNSRYSSIKCDMAQFAWFRNVFGLFMVNAIVTYIFFFMPFLFHLFLNWSFLELRNCEIAKYKTSLTKQQVDIDNVLVRP